MLLSEVSIPECNISSVQSTHRFAETVTQCAVRVCSPLQVHRGVMPSHTMYALNVERILARLWHPSHEELEQDRVHRQRLAIKEGLLVS